MNKMSVVGAGVMLCSFLGLGACASSPDAATASDGTATSSLSAPVFFNGPPPGEFARPCVVSTASSVAIVTVPPSYVVRLPDADGAPYGFTDGFSVPFPTAWLCPPGGGTHCTNEPRVSAYENALIAATQHMPHREFLVYQLDTPVAKGLYAGPAPYQYGVKYGGRQWFYDGTTTIDDADGMAQAVSDFDGYPKVDPTLLHCTYVMQVAPNGNLVYTGFHAPVAQAHDPVNWPD